MSLKGKNSRAAQRAQLELHLSESGKSQSSAVFRAQRPSTVQPLQTHVLLYRNLAFKEFDRPTTPRLNSPTPSSSSPSSFQVHKPRCRARNLLTRTLRSTTPRRICTLLYTTRCIMLAVSWMSTRKLPFLSYLSCVYQLVYAIVRSSGIDAHTNIMVNL